MKKKFLAFIFLGLFFSGSVGLVLAATGTIDLVSKYAWSDKIGWINFAPTNNSGNYVGLSLTDTDVSGYAWSENFGWINFSPTNGGVSNSEGGNLSGYAFGENTGWIDFTGVNITCIGKFTGNASGDIAGTINFDCDNCGVSTDWLPTQGCGSHNECSNNQCVSVVGPGTDQCSEDSDCTSEVHYECNAQKQCIVADGPGFDQCVTDVDCTTTHGECSNNQCISVVGLGVEQCLDDVDCADEVHNACNNFSQCVVVDGPGINACQTDADCGFLKISEEHNECNFFKQCVVANGPGANECQVDLDCGVPTKLEELLKDTLQPTIENIQTVAEVIKKIVSTPAGILTTRVITTTGVAIVTTAAAATALIATGTILIPSLFDIMLSIIRLWGIILTGFGIKKKIKYWGTVYDSVTKQPLDPAQVILYDMNGKEVTTSITDIDGRYGFLVEPGKYTIIAKKTNYAFPSKKLINRSNDEMYSNLYFGTPIEIKNIGDVIAENIPMDPVKFDWNEFAKKNKTFMKFYSNWDVVIRRVIDFSYAIGFVVAIIAFLVVPQPYNSIILGIYLLLLFLRMFGLKPKSFGYIIDKTTGVPLSFAIVKVMMPSTSVEISRKVADAYGRYYCLVPKGRYQIKIEKKNSEDSYSLVYTSSIIDVKKKGIIREKFRVDTGSTPSVPDQKNKLDSKNMPDQKNLPNQKNGNDKLDIEPSLLIHQLKSPLSSMKLSTEMFLDGNFGKLTKEQKEIIEKMHQKSESLISLVNDLSDITKVKQKFSSFTFAPVDIQGLMWEISALKKEDIDAKKINFKINETKISQVKADKEKISIALENIFDNAIKYNNLSGKIEISFEDKKDSVLVKFIDSGIGIPSPEKGNIFSKFFRATNAKKIDQFGSGLGLFIARSIIENHSGKIWFESEENKGSTFFVELPKN